MLPFSVGSEGLSILFNALFVARTASFGPDTGNDPGSERVPLDSSSSEDGLEGVE